MAATRIVGIVARPLFLVASNEGLVGLSVRVGVRVGIFPARDVVGPGWVSEIDESMGRFVYVVRLAVELSNLRQGTVLVGFGKAVKFVGVSIGVFSLRLSKWYAKRVISHFACLGRAV